MWSPGLKAACGVDDITDEQAAEAETPARRKNWRNTTTRRGGVSVPSVCGCWKPQNAAAHRRSGLRSQGRMTRTQNRRRGHRPRRRRAATGRRPSRR